MIIKQRLKDSSKQNAYRTRGNQVAAAPMVDSGNTNFTAGKEAEAGLELTIIEDSAAVSGSRGGGIEDSSGDTTVAYGEPSSFGDGSSVMVEEGRGGRDGFDDRNPTRPAAMCLLQARELDGGNVGRAKAATRRGRGGDEGMAAPKPATAITRGPTLSSVPLSLATAPMVRG
ncbi:uncharacterized protein DS421_13g425140 [Arachis hypogaea]|nr:uncharacterized protein DS421_13g425140 [Arachis hypogaea]